jgi:hypothetical protein
MTIEITSTNGAVVVTYTNSDGKSASAVVVGESETSVKERKEQIVDAHDLDQF